MWALAGAIALAAPAVGVHDQSTPDEPAHERPDGRAQELFLAAIRAIEAKHYGEAIRLFRQAIAIDPAAPRLRLELARAFYLAKDYDNASFQFKRALAGDLPAEVAANALRFLALIRQERRWSYSATIGVAPDSNINGGSSAREAILFGLPFELSDDARQRSGVGLASGGSVEFAPAIGDRTRMRAGLSFSRRDHRGTRFDDTLTQAWAGPSWSIGNKDIRLAATGLARWHGGRTYQRALGLEAGLTLFAGTRTAVTVQAQAQSFRYPGMPAQNGPVWTLSGGVVRMLSPTTTLSIEAAGRRQKTHARDLASTAKLVGLGGQRDLPLGFTISASVIGGIQRFDTPDLLFGVRRRDRTAELSLGVLNRRISLWRFTPTLTVIRSRRASNIDLFDSRQTRAEFGLTSRF